MFRAHMSCFQNLHRLFLVGAMERMTDGRFWWIGGSATMQSLLPRVARPGLTVEKTGHISKETGTTGLQGREGISICMMHFCSSLPSCSLCMANFCLTLQEDKLKRPLSDIESWKLARERSDRKDGESQYYGKTEEHLESYTQQFHRLHPDVPDVAQSQIDDTAVVAIQGKPHVRYPCFDGLITPSVSYTRLRTTNSSPLESTERSQPPLARQHVVSTSPLSSFSLTSSVYFQHCPLRNNLNFVGI